MQLDDKMLQNMLRDHKGRAGELEALLTRGLKRLEEKAEGSEIMPDVKALLQIALRYYRHVGAIWTLESMINSVIYDWTQSTAHEDNGRNTDS